MRLKDLPELTFAAADPQAVDIEVVATVEALLGRKLERADPLRIFLRGVEAVIIQQRLLIDQAAKQNLLSYATGDVLDHMGIARLCERLPATAAVTTVEVTLSTAREVSTTIRKGTRVTADDKIYFALDEDVIILAGSTSTTARATCTVTGTVGNGYAGGEINRIVDPQAFLYNIVNVTVTEGGSDIEDDEAYRERIHEAMEAFSCAGSEGSYNFLVKSASALISDVQTVNGGAGVVKVYPLLAGGQLPGTEMLQLIQERLDARTVRPLTDQVFVYPPTVAEYAVDVTYWIARSDAVQAAAIDEAAQSAVTAYVDWQRAKLGRDINPSELIHRLKAAGVKRVEVRSPTFTATDKFTVAIPSSVAATFAGLEDD